MTSETRMTKKERVRLALAHSEPDRVPKGEISIEAGIANRLLHSDYPDDYQHYERDRRIRELLNIDYINIGDWPTEFLAAVLILTSLTGLARVGTARKE